MTITGQRHKVLVIDDSFMVRKSLVEQLSGNRFEVFEAKDGPSGLDQAAKILPDVILLDFVMPGMNGFEVYQALRQQPQFTNTPVIVISSSREEVIKKFGQPFVGFDFLPKQFTREQLEERIDAVLPMAQSVPVAAPPAPASTPVTTDLQSVYGSILMRLEQLEGRVMMDLAQVRQRLQSVPTPPALPPEVLERLGRIELAVARERSGEILDRLAILENRPGPDYGLLLDGVEARLGMPEFLSRMSNLERKLTGFEGGSSAGDTVSPEVMAKLDQLSSRPDRTSEVLDCLSSLEQRLPSDRTSEVLDRLSSLEQRLPSDDRTSEVLDRLSGLEQHLPSDRTSEVLDRLSGLEQRLPSDRTSEVLDRLSGLEQRLPSDRTSEVLDRLSGLEQHLPSDRTSEVLDRLSSLEQHLPSDRTSEVLDRLSGLEQRLPSERTLEILDRLGYGSGATTDNSEVLSRLDSIEDRLKYLPSPVDPSPALSRLDSRLETLVRDLEQSGTSDLTPVLTKLAQLEAKLAKVTGEVPSETTSTFSPLAIGTLLLVVVNILLTFVFNR